MMDRQPYYERAAAILRTNHHVPQPSMHARKALDASGLFERVAGLMRVAQGAQLRIAELEAALEFYADAENWNTGTNGTVFDSGHRARKALGR